MAKQSKTLRNSRSGAYKIAGKLPDGVKILEPKTKPTHFTSREIRETINDMRRDSMSGQFLASRDRAKSGHGKSHAKKD